MDSILVPAPAIITLKENETFDWLILTTESDRTENVSGSIRTQPFSSRLLCYHIFSFNCFC